MINKINPEIAAHNIATAFCECQIQKLPESAFIPGDIEHSGKAAKEIMQLYANIYDFVFEAVLQENSAFVFLPGFTAGLKDIFPGTAGFVNTFFTLL